MFRIDVMLGLFDSSDHVHFLYPIGTETFLLSTGHLTLTDCSELVVVAVWIKLHMYGCTGVKPAV